MITHTSYLDTTRYLSDILGLVIMLDMFDRSGLEKKADSKTLRKIMVRVKSEDSHVYMLLLSYYTTGYLTNDLLDRMVDKQCSLMNSNCLPMPKLNKLEEYL
jgi:bifunctional ADP-heptose synthase (sugar kinase/adenylyltransferase)